ncbi:hypothetical protein C8F04DRAFT_1340922 [Mycena alexandri]|uniref:Uncharacterized protein n=1 Tax=Mycena alexandri TaxID=1745969 RepID=A0AAD6SXJ4_9AGAR|nr:hypothetical protein C8F04DRAFT_1340922 [Mycena alexandri]
MSESSHGSRASGRVRFRRTFRSRGIAVVNRGNWFRISVVSIVSVRAQRELVRITKHTPFEAQLRLVLLSPCLFIINAIKSELRHGDFFVYLHIRLERPLYVACRDIDLVDGTITPIHRPETGSEHYTRRGNYCVIPLLPSEMAWAWAPCSREVKIILDQITSIIITARTRAVNIPAQSEVATFKLRSRSWTWNRGLEHDSTSNFEIDPI